MCGNCGMCAYVCSINIKYYLGTALDSNSWKKCSFFSCRFRCFFFRLGAISYLWVIAYWAMMYDQHSWRICLSYWCLIWCEWKSFTPPACVFCCCCSRPRVFISAIRWRHNRHTMMLLLGSLPGQEEKKKKKNAVDAWNPTACQIHQIFFFQHTICHTSPQVATPNEIRRAHNRFDNIGRWHRTKSQRDILALDFFSRGCFVRIRVCRKRSVLRPSAVKKALENLSKKSFIRSCCLCA